MAFPGILRRLFANNGAGPLLRPDIVPIPKITKYDLCRRVYGGDLCPTPLPGMVPVIGTLITGANTKYPEAWDYLQTAEGQKMCVTEAQWQALVNYVFYTTPDGTKFGFNGIGGAPKYVIDVAAKTIRVPDLRGMYEEPAGFDLLGVGGVHGDATRRLTGRVGNSGWGLDWEKTPSGVFFNDGDTARNNGAQAFMGMILGFDTMRQTAVASKNQPRAWGSLACVCLDPSAS